MMATYKKSYLHSQVSHQKVIHLS